MGGKKTSLILCAVFFAGAVLAVEYNLKDYDVIIERSPFGEDSSIISDDEVQAKTDAEALKTAKEMEKKIRLCYLLEAENGEIRAGFENKTAKSDDPKSIMLMVNENFRGMKLIKIDLANSSATLSVAGKPVTFTLSKATPAKKTVKKPAVPTRKFGGGFRREAPKQPEKPTAPKLTPEEQVKKREEVREGLRQYQMEVLRSGMPALPIPLTQDMDDQLVLEGVLPPSE